MSRIQYKDTIVYITKILLDTIVYICIYFLVYIFLIRFLFYFIYIYILFFIIFIFYLFSIFYFIDNYLSRYTRFEIQNRRQNNLNVSIVKLDAQLILWIFSLGLVYSFLSRRFGSWVELNITTFVTHPVYCPFFSFRVGIETY